MTTQESRDAAAEAARPPSRWERLLYRVVRNILVGFCRVFWRLEVHGMEKVPASGPFVLSGVHRSNIDTPLVAGVTTRRLRFMGKHTMWRYDPIGRFFTALGGFPVHRGTADREALRKVQAILRAGEPVVMFPEGQRRMGPVIEEIFEGPAFVAGRTGAPIVPVGIGGSEDAMKPGSALLRPVKVILLIGEPIPAPVGKNGGRPSRPQVRETTAVLHDRLQELFDEAQRLVGKPNAR